MTGLPVNCLSRELSRLHFQSCIDTRLCELLLISRLTSNRKAADKVRLLQSNKDGCEELKAGTDSKFHDKSASCYYRVRGLATCKPPHGVLCGECYSFYVGRIGPQRASEHYVQAAGPGVVSSPPPQPRGNGSNVASRMGTMVINGMATGADVVQPNSSRKPSRDPL